MSQKIVYHLHSNVIGPHGDLALENQHSALITDRSRVALDEFWGDLSVKKKFRGILLQSELILPD